MTTPSKGAETADAVVLRRISFKARIDNVRKQRAAIKPGRPRVWAVEAIVS